ncbi:pyridoxamine 5'-phosphate oxidase family protein [Agromyces sp. LHK192]|uniref:pyridoxamine 5'-phosphate oxidase family protein n=1 Tax=Agromyces sp. LHK192 TaxID=2498704 RepID=UPI000FDCCC9C|nr:pyridoxamine 5'-phosphate oxidase family protein [Agromyces sp. LHK192]
MDAAPLSPFERARRVVEANTYLTLATADASGNPWATPVWFAPSDDLRDWYWMSRPATRHSANLAERGSAAFAVFDSGSSTSGAQAVYGEGAVSPVAEDDLDRHLAVYAERSIERGEGVWDRSRVTGSAPLRLYRLHASALYALDENEHRLEVLLE